MIEHFPSKDAAASFVADTPLQSNFERYRHELKTNNEYAPFTNKLDWEIAKWAKDHGLTATAVNALLRIEGVVEMLGLSYKNAREMNKLIDAQLPGRPQFQRSDIKVGGEEMTMYSRDILQCIRALLGDPEFTAQLILRPERHYRRSGERWDRVFHDMHTGNWWWEMQSVLEAHQPGAMLVPVIISSDRTQVTVFGNKTAYPVYLTIGNLPKDIRRKSSARGQILLAYLPTSKLRCVTNHASRRRMISNLFHSCLRQLLAPLEGTGVDGLVMVDGNGISRRVHPVLATYVGDYPEQVLVTCVKTGECPKCEVARSDLGDMHASACLRDIRTAHAALSKVDGSAWDYIKACQDARIKPVFHPFWQGLPYVDIFQAITPDILHQVQQGIFKHLINWLVQAYGASEIDARFQRLIPNHHIHKWSNGITGLSRVTGKEHGLMSRVILGVIGDMSLPGGFNAARLIRAVRSLLDFIFIAQLPIVSISELEFMTRALEAFHDNKAILVDLGIRDNFNIPKLHALIHYVTSVQLFGSTDNYNTQHTERLHIDYTKDAYRATNTREEFPQMTKWLERQEKVECHEKYIKWHNQNHGSIPTPYTIPRVMRERQIKMTRYPTIQAVSLDDLVLKYGAEFFCDAFARYVVLWRNPHISRANLESEALDVHIPFRTVSVYHRIRFEDKGQGHGDTYPDTIHIQPHSKNKKGELIPGRFDTGLVCCTPDRSGIHAYRVAQVRIVFSISPTALKHLFGNNEYPPQHLAYVEWFTPFKASPEADSKLHKVERSRHGNGRLSSIIPVTDIAQSIHLSPLPGRVIPREWNSNTVLDNCRSFLVNAFSDSHTYLSFYDC
ncbi:hypothetical protein JOM56_004758 [Amanita muscaria]